MEQFSIARPKGLTVMTKEEAIAAAEKLGYHRGEPYPVFLLG